MACGSAVNGPAGLVADGDADPEDVLLVLGREVEEVLAVLLGRVRRPHLPARPRHVRDVERDAVVGDLAADRVHRQHVVVAHREVAAEVVLRHAGLEVVRGVDVDPALEHVSRRVRGVDVADQRLRQELRRVGLRALKPASATLSLPPGAGTRFDACSMPHSIYRSLTAIHPGTLVAILAARTMASATTSAAIAPSAVSDTFAFERPVETVST